MTIEFKRGHKVSMTMQETGNPPETSEGDYLVDGNKVTIQMADGMGMPLVLVRDGNTLSAPFMGQMLRFEKK